MHIIVKRSSARFTPHYNREFGKYYHSSRDYVSDMKRAGVEPYRPDKVSKPSSKPYVRSEWGNEMMKDIKSRKGRKPGDRFIKELEKRGYSQKSAEAARKLANGK